MAEALRILVAEDDSNDVILLQRAFFKAGVKAPVNFVCDGQGVIDYLQGVGPFNDREAHPMPTLLLLDLKMPRVDGFGVLEWLRQHPDFGELLVMVLTSSSQPADVNRAYALGARSYHVKPVDHGELIALAGLIADYWQNRIVPQVQLAAAPMQA